MQCFRGNSVSIETVLLKMPLVWKNTYLHSAALYAHKYRNISVPMCLVCIWKESEKNAHVSALLLVVLLMHTPEVNYNTQLQATYVRSSITHLALWEKKWEIVSLILLAVLVPILFWLCSSNQFLQIRLRRPNSPYIISLTLTVCRSQNAHSSSHMESTTCN